MHVLFDARLLHRSLSGLERVQRNLVRELNQCPEVTRLQVVVTAGTRLPEGFPKGAEVVEVRNTEDILEVLLPDDPDQRPDVYHLSWFPDRMPRDLLLLVAAKAVVVEVHDAILNRHPEYHESADKWQWYDGFVRQLVTNADRLLVHSESVAGEVESNLGGQRSQCDVAPLAVDPSLQDNVSDEDVRKCRRRHGIEVDYFVALGKDYPHKDHATLFRALAELPPEIHVIVAGEKVWHDGRDTDDLIEDLKLGSRVRWISGLHDKDIKALLQGSLGLVYPSLEEGFGLPPIEAMWHSTPVLAARSMSIPEVCGDGAWLFEPGDHAELAKLMRKVLAGGAEVDALVARGTKRAAEFSWSRCAAEVVKCYENARKVAAERGDARTAGVIDMLAHLSRSPHDDAEELHTWQDRCRNAERHLRNVEAERDDLVKQLQELQLQVGLSVMPTPAPAVLENGVARPRWSLRRRLRKIRSALFGD